jgi:hypothetical protein
VYCWNIFIGESHPNGSSWIVWSFLSALNFGSYKKVTVDWKKSLLSGANASMTIIITIFALWTGSFKAISLTDSICLVIGIIAGICWFIWKSANIAQVLILSAIIIGFIPTYVGVYHTPTIEPLIPWMLWTISFSTQYLLIKRTSNGNRVEFFYPVSMVICHGAVFLMVALLH